LSAHARDVVGLIPVAGHARRLPGLPCSKEILPVGFPGEEPRPACLHLLEYLREAGVRRAFLVLRRGKWDIPALLGAGEGAGLELAYVVVDETAGIVHTLDRAFGFVEDRIVALGFPDTLIRPPDAFARLLERQRARNADVVLGMFPTDRPEKTDMVRVDADGRVCELVVKDASSRLTHNWALAVWNPRFTRFLHEFVSQPRRLLEETGGGELYPGHVLRAGIREGLHVEGVTFAEGRFLDVGTPDDLRRAATPSR
jgi:glucose-1-phosphate thymidylyltransferase